MILLDKICHITSGQNAPQGKSYYDLGKYTFIKVSDLDRLILDNNELNSTKINDLALDNYKLKLFPCASIIFAKSGLSCLKNRIYVTKERAYIVNHLCILYDIDKKYNPKWLALFLKKYNVTKFIKDKAYPSISLSNIKKILVPEISRDKQDIIVNYFDDIIEMISIKKNELLELDELIKSRFNEMFAQYSDNKIAIRGLVSLKKISAKRKYSNNDIIKYIDISSVNNSKNIIETSTDYLFAEAPSRAQQCLLNKDILISTVRPNLRNIALFDLTGENFVGSSGFCVLRSIKCNPYYLLQSVLSDDFTNSMISLTSGASYPAIRDKDVYDYQIINAPLELQNEFGDFVKLIDKSKLIIEKQIKELQELFDSKMDQYFG